jgi:hypothetical protein
MIPLALALATTGCYAETGTTTLASADVVSDDGYDPAYYDGYVVYYDNGRPYYYDRGTVVWISPSSPHYAPLVRHYHYYGPRYERWNAHYGNRYHGYRGAPHYHHYRR